MNKRGEANTIVIGIIAALIGFGHYMHVNHGWGPQTKTIDKCDHTIEGTDISVDSCAKHGPIPESVLSGD